MSKYIVVVFSNESQAHKGSKALKELQEQGSLNVHGMALITKEADGKLSLKDEADEGPLGTAVGAVVGGLIGLIGGPVGVAVGVAGGALIGSTTDLFNYGVGEDFVDEVSRNLTPGKAALIAEIDEYWTIPLDISMEALGGIVLRQWRLDVENTLIENEVRARNEELAELKAEYAQAKSENKARLKARIDNAEAKLKAAIDREKTKVEALKQQADAKIKALQDRAAKANTEIKTKIDQRIAAIHAESEKLAAKLRLSSGRMNDTPET